MEAVVEPPARPRIRRRRPCRLTPSNRRVRTRTHGGVGGEEPRGSPLSRLRYGPAGDSAPRLRLKAPGMTERFPFGPSTRPEPTTPFFPREQRVFRIGPQAVQGAKRRSVPLTARTDLERFAVRERRSEPTELLSQYTWAQLLILEIVR